VVVDIEAYDSLPSLAVINGASPIEWAQIWARGFSSGISTFRGRPSLPWAQGVPSSNLGRPDHQFRSRLRSSLASQART